jgi:hypothetical protein
MTTQPQSSTFDKFWSNAGPGLFDLGAGMYSRNRAQSEAAGRLNQAQGPAYTGQMDAAQRVLGEAGNFDPRAAGAERLKAQQGLLAGQDAKSEADLIRMLRSKGMLGAATFNPGVEGITPNGTAMNPQMAAFYAARNARDAKMSAGALDAGEAQLDRQLNRAGMLQRNANANRTADLDALRTQPSRSASDMQMLSGISGILRDTGALKALPGMIGGGMDWLKKLGGGGDAYSAGQGTDFGEWGGW